MRASAILVLLISLFVSPALGQDDNKARVVTDPARLTADVVEVMRVGDVGLLEEKLHRYGRRDRTEVSALIAGVSGLIQGREPVYVDKILERRIGTAFYESLHGTFYGEQTFLFFRLTLAKVEDGWILLSFAFDTDPKGYLY